MPTQILMPRLSPTMEEGKLAAWHVKEGDRVRSGDVVAEIETDKATMEVEAPEDGVIEKLLLAAGTEHVPVNHPIALLADGEMRPAPPASFPSPLGGEDAALVRSSSEAVAHSAPGEGLVRASELELPSPQPSPQWGEGVQRRAAPLSPPSR